MLLARNGVPPLRAGYDVADHEKHTPLTPERESILRSIEKLITRITMWQFVAAGHLQLAVPIGTLLPNGPPRDVHDRVTTDQLTR